ncbi:hypothetical protein [Blastococcus sp. SYSU D00820]
MSQPPYAQPPVPPAGGPQPPAAPTQVGFPGQVQLAPQPQYAPTPQQAAQQGGPLAVGFPNYRSPAPSPKNRTGLIVGTIVVLLTIAFAVIGFLIVSDRGAGSPEGAVEGVFASIVDRDGERIYELTCESARANVTEDQIQAELDAGAVPVSTFEVGEGTETTLPDGRPGYLVPVTFTATDGSQGSFELPVVDERGWRICGDALF